MIFHIIKQNESVKDLMFKYGLDKSEIASSNQHVSNWDMLVPGIKLKIPIVNERLVEHLDDVEPFIEDYYPRDEDDTVINSQETLAFSTEPIHQPEPVPVAVQEKKEVKTLPSVKNIQYPKKRYYNGHNPNYRRLYYDPIRKIYLYL